MIGVTTVQLGRRRRPRSRPFPLPDLQAPPEITATSVRFVQTAGGRTGAAGAPAGEPPAVRAVHAADRLDDASRSTIHADGTADFEVVGASTFPRHWIYDADGKLAAKVGLTDFKDW